ncbi:heme exporter protein CcmD [Pseudolabrys taiwanensis]|uniref:Heme exporter protein D n=1 Tax=Pseudolabrys taiwanensis TaxID=331696 RepID=A0A346A096_9HYPH|nr:heme exporter protein CcmD [Pseudolabrys taiwanensis]AXK82593.1 heme exporter protein CcmD [Pseudolabrys taiwanensis]
MSLGPHADFIIASYALTAFVIAAMVAWVVLDYSAQRRVLGELEERGVGRRARNEGQS